MIDDLKTFTAIAVVPASDADALTPDDIAANAADADAIRAETTNIANSRWVIARRLREVKKRLGHGKFLRWLDHEKLGWCARKARIDMQIVRAFESESDFRFDPNRPHRFESALGSDRPPGGARRGASGDEGSRKEVRPQGRGVNGQGIRRQA